jgi:sugar O-acyltransferase (sialic acid O-acetyltransferase NeuD family)
VSEAANLSDDYEVIGFLDDGATNDKSGNLPVLGRIADLPNHLHEADAVHVAMGKNALREQISDVALSLGADLVSVIHPRAIISPSASIGVGSAIMAGAVIGTEANLGKGVIVNCGAVIDHDCEVGDYAHLGIQAAMAGGACLGAKAWMKAGSVLRTGCRVPEGEVLGFGESKN